MRFPELMKREIGKGNTPREKHFPCAWQNVTDKRSIRREVEWKSTLFKKVIAVVIQRPQQSYCQNASLMT